MCTRWEAWITPIAPRNLSEGPALDRGPIGTKELQKDQIMKAATIAGIALIALGTIGLVYGGLSFTTKEKAVDLGPIEIVTEEKHDLPIPEIASIIAVIAGIGLVAVGMRKA
jgi:hypothetical protein